MDPLKMMVDLKKMPQMLAEAFDAPLAMQEEYLLRGLEVDLATEVNQILEQALAGEFMINISQKNQDRLREMNAIRKVIRDILASKGIAGASLTFDN